MLTEEKILYYLNELLQKGDLYKRQMAGFAKVKEILGFNEQTPSANAADIIFEIIEKKNE